MRTGNVVVIPAYNEEGYISSTLDALAVQTVPPEAIVVVDNNSTDDTGGVVLSRQRDFKNLHLIFEGQKGTGIACNTGFRYAIDELGAQTISRTDADASPYPDWNEIICKYFTNNAPKQLISGPSLPRQDEAYRLPDELLWPIYRRLWLLGNLSSRWPILPLRLARGYNMAIRKRAFDEVDGFPNSSIEECDEDVVLSRRVIDSFGFEAIAHCRDMKVEVSMRRQRYLSMAGLVLYYWKPSYEKRMRATSGNIDVR
jgi:glycosyltransferase involved in cell wall biosynthesis